MLRRTGPSTVKSRVTRCGWGQGKLFLLLTIPKSPPAATFIAPIAVKRREVKTKGEKERYKHLNAEFQRIARRDKKAFLSDQCKEIEE